MKATVGNAATAGRWNSGIDSSAAGRRPRIVPIVPARISAAGVRRNSRSTRDAAVTVVRPKIPPRTNPIPEPITMPISSRAVVCDPVFVATCHPPAAKSATMISRTNSTMRPRPRPTGSRRAAAGAPFSIAGGSWRVAAPSTCGERGGAGACPGPMRGTSDGGARALREGLVRLLQDPVDHGLGLVLRDVVGERQLRDQDLPRLGQHPLLARGQALVLLPDGEVAHD